MLKLCIQHCNTFAKLWKRSRILGLSPSEGMLLHDQKVSHLNIEYQPSYSVFSRDVTDLSSAMLEVQRTNMAAAHTEQPSQNALE